jgi:hypothetical protein
VTLRDPDIRAPLLLKLQAENQMTVEEFTVDGARADIIGMTEDRLIAYEIKSDADTHVRLAHQADAYDRIATHLYLVTTTKKLKKMMDIIPPWWGVLLAHEGKHGVTFSEHLDARPNPAWNVLDALQLLWTAELDILMSQNNLPLREGRPKSVKAKRVASTLGTEATKRIWLQHLRNRYVQNPELRGIGKRFVSQYTCK